MKKGFQLVFKKAFFLCLLIPFSGALFAQGNATPACEFWKKVRFGGGVGLNVGSGFTDISLAPSAVYAIDDRFSVGTGLQASYISSANNFKSINYGASVFGLANVTPQIQLSVDLEQVKVNTTYPSGLNLPTRQFWNTALFLGAGYITNGITLGVKYNVLFKESDQVYNDALIPFVRVFF